MQNKTNPTSASLRKLWPLLGASQKKTLLVAVLARLVLNILDLVALAGVGVLAFALGSSGFGTKALGIIRLPILGDIQIGPREAVLLALAVAALFLLKSCGAIWSNFWIGDQISKIETDFTARVFNSLFSRTAEIPKIANSSAEIQNLVTTSSKALFADLLNSAFVIIAEGSLLLVVLIGFILINPLATVGLVLYLGLVVLILNRVIERLASTTYVRGYEAGIGTFNATSNLLATQRELRLSRKAHQWVDVIATSKREHSSAVARTASLSNLPRYVVESALILGVLSFLGLIVVLSDLQSQAVTIGIFLAGGLRLVASVIPLQTAFTLQKQASFQGWPVYKVLREIALQSPIDFAGTTANEDVEVGLTLQGVGLVGRDDFTVLENISFQFKSGLKYALVGPTGAGKSSIFEVALGFRKITSGHIEINGETPEQFIKSHPGALGYVPQRPEIIHGTLLQNVTLQPNSDTLDLERLEAILDFADLRNLVRKLPMGLNTALAPGSNQLSGGEIQRLGLARALFSKPRFLFLDEATSALDANTESRISKALDELKTHVTVILIAHRLSTVKNADRILYIENGLVQASGTFDELLESSPDFRRAVKELSTD